jgi:hypothetical protein
MRKANEKNDVIVGRFFEFSPEQLDLLSARMKLAIRERVNPGEVITIEAAPGLYFYHDPRVLRSDIERRISFTEAPGLEYQASETIKPQEENHAISQ